MFVRVCVCLSLSLFFLVSHFSFSFVHSICRSNIHTDSDLFTSMAFVNFNYSTHSLLCFLFVMFVFFGVILQFFFVDGWLFILNNTDNNNKTYSRTHTLVGSLADRIGQKSSCIGVIDTWIHNGRNTFWARSDRNRFCCCITFDLLHYKWNTTESN